MAGVEWSDVAVFVVALSTEGAGWSSVAPIFNSFAAAHRQYCVPFSSVDGGLSDSRYIRSLYAWILGVSLRREYFWRRIANQGALMRRQDASRSIRVHFT